MYQKAENLPELIRNSGLAKDRGAMRLFAAYRRTGDRNKYEKLVKWGRQKMCEDVDKIQPDPFFPGPLVEDLGERGAKIGTEIHKQKPFYWQPKEWTLNCLISGPIGSGKTNTVLNLIQYFTENDVTCLVYDKRGDYLPLTRTPIEAVTIPWEKMKFNPLSPPEGVPVQRWKEKVEDSYAHIWGLLTGSKSLFSKVLTAAYREKEIPTLLDLHNLLTRYKTGGSSQSQYKSRNEARLSMIIEKYKDMVNCTKGFQFEKLIQGGRCIILELDMEEEAGNWFLLLVLWSLYYHRRYNQESSKYPLAVFLDEARYLIRERRRQREHFVMDIDELFTRSRPLNISYIVAEHMTNQISKAIRANTKLKLCFGAEAEELRSAHQMLGLKKEQTKEIPRLALEECVGRFGGERCPIPFRLKTKQFKYDNLVNTRMSHQEVIEAASPFIQKLNRDVVPASKSGKIATAEHKVLYNIAKYPQLTKSQRNLEGISYSRRNRILDRLKRDKLIKRILFKTGGKPAELYQVTKEGKRELESVGYEIPRTPGRGGVIHSYMVRKIVDFYEQKGCDPDTEFQVGDMQIDVVAKSIDGQGGFEAVQVHYKNKVSEEVRVIKKLLTQPYYSKLFVVSDKEGKLTRLKKKVDKSRNGTFLTFFTLQAFLDR